jgi:NAD(P)-dependent dehydrogenase (short-subunit alcohol dehydrogenase family)
MAFQPPVVLVTGAAKRLGREIALTLSQGGWCVALHCRSSRADALQTEADCAAFTPTLGVFEADLANEAQTLALARAVREAAAGRGLAWRGLVNSASLFEFDDAAHFGHARFAAHMNANVAAPVLLARELAAQAVADNAASCVVNLLDQKLWNPNPDFLSYTLSKAALESATTTLALALAPQVRVVGVAPGLTLTSHMLNDDEFKALHKLSPLQRSSSPQDVAATVRFALENQSITGTTILVDGGQHLMRFERDFSMMKDA